MSTGWFVRPPTMIWATGITARTVGPNGRCLKLTIGIFDKVCDVENKASLVKDESSVWVPLSSCSFRYRKSGQLFDPPTWGYACFMIRQRYPYLPLEIDCPPNILSPWPRSRENWRRYAIAIWLSSSLVFFEKIQTARISSASADWQRNKGVNDLYDDDNQIMFKPKTGWQRDFEI
jgi:hypothetical protein